MRFDDTFQSEAKTPLALLCAEGFVGVLDDQVALHFIKDKRTYAVQRFGTTYLEDFDTSSVISPNGKTLLLWHTSKSRFVLLSFNEAKKGFGDPRTIHGVPIGITKTAFSADGTLIALGTLDGRVWVVHTHSGKPLFTLPKLGDAICALAFNDSASMIAYGCYNRTIAVFDLVNFQTLRTFKGDQPPLKLSFLHSRAQLVIGGKNHIVYLYDIDSRVSRVLCSLKEQISAMWIDSEDGFVLVGDKLGRLYAVETEGGSERAVFWQLDAEARGICLFDGVIYLLLANGAVLMLNHHSHIALLQSYLENGGAAQIAELAVQYPLIRHTRTYRRLRTLFLQAHSQALAAYANGDDHKAEELIAPFTADQSFAAEITALRKFAPNILPFCEAVACERIEKVYAFIKSNPLYKKIDRYAQMQKNFAMRFNAAAIALCAKNPDRITAKTVLGVFAQSASTIKLVQALFDTPQLFKVANDLLKQREYKSFIKLYEKYPIIKESPPFERYEEIAMSEVDEFLNAYNDSLLAKALMHSRNISEFFPLFYEGVKPYVQNALIRQAFEIAWLDNNITSALSYVLRNPQLSEHPFYMQIMQSFNDKLNMAMKHAFALKFDEMHAILAPLLKNRYYKERAIMVYGAFYLAEIAQKAAALSEEEWHSAFLRYLERFGKTEPLALLAAKHGQDILLDKLAHFAQSSFAQKPFLTSVVELG